MRLPTLGLAALFLSLAACTSDAPKETVPESPKARSGPRFLSDESGRALILRGTNVESAAKSEALHRISLTDEEIRFMGREMGFNFVRYLIFWDRMEPEPGRYDESYLDQIVTDIERFHQAGMWVLVDMHQDVYAARFCCDGAPEWAIRDNGEPFELQENWAFNYFEPAVKAAFDNFWAHTDGDHPDLQDHYVAMWRHVANRLKTVPGILGYDIMNEPHPGSDFDTTEILTRAESESSRDFDRNKLGPFHQRAIDAIRKADNERFIFFEPRYGSPGNGSPSYHEPLVDPREGESRLAYAPHLYSFGLEAKGAYSKNDTTFALWEKERRAEIERQEMPLVLGEWGLAYGATDAERYVRELAEMSERMLLGWAHWSWDPSGPEGWSLYNRSTKTLNPMFDVIDRPYPRATAGEPTLLHFDLPTSTLRFEWEEREGITGETEVFVPMARETPSAYTVTLSDAEGSWSYAWDESLPGLLRIRADQTTPSHTLIVKPAGE